MVGERRLGTANREMGESACKTKGRYRWLCKRPWGIALALCRPWGMAYAAATPSLIPPPGSLTNGGHLTWQRMIQHAVSRSELSTFRKSHRLAILAFNFDNARRSP